MILLVRFNKNAAEEDKWSMVELPYSWMMQHSKMDPKHHDGIIFGVSKAEHLEDAIKICKRNRKLPQALLQATKNAWQLCQGDCPRYFQ